MENDIHILIAENDLYTRLALTLILEDEGYTVSAAENGLEALDLVLDLKSKSINIDLIVTDLQMPLLNGFDLIQALSQKGFSIPSMIITCYKNGEIDLISGFQNLHGDKPLKYIGEKPSLASELLRDIKKILSSYGKLKENVRSIVEETARNQKSKDVSFIKKNDANLNQSSSL